MPKNNKVVKQPSSQRNLAKSNVSPSSQPDERLIESKKSLSSGNYTKFSQKIFKGDDYLPTFIKEAKDPHYAQCLMCKEENQSSIKKDKGQKPKLVPKEFLVSSLYIHLDSKAHRSNQTKNIAKLEASLKVLKFDSNKLKEDQEENKNRNDTSCYLQFIGYLMSLNLSYSQIEKIGKFLQKDYKAKKLGFLPNFSFDQRLISQLTQDCFSKVLTEELLDQLRKNPYSIIVDNATFGGENLSAIKVKYLDRQWSSELNHDITLVHNKIISLTNLKDTSSGQTLNEIIHEKLFQDQDIKKNLVGFVHDNASNLKGDNSGLSSLLKKDGCTFLDICDPCHGLALSIKHSLKELPEPIIIFLQTISNHFSSPQNKAILRNIQKEGDFKVLTPKHLAPTRWLSLGQVLDRILEIWASNILNL